MEDKSRSTNKLVIIILISILTFIGLSYYYSTTYHKQIKEKKKMYCYETFSGPANAALYVDYENEGEELIKYYKQVEKGENPIIKFPLQSVLTDTPVYILEFIGKDSALVKIAQYSNRIGKIRSEFTKGYIYKETLHSSPLLHTK